MIRSIVVMAQVFTMMRAVDPGAHIQIDRAWAYRESRVNWECVTFTNVGTRTATSVEFAFTYYDRDRGPVGADTLTLRGTYPPGVTVDGRDRRACTRFRFPPEGISRNVVAVRSVTYDDGTAWTPAVRPPAAVRAVRVRTSATPWPTPTPYVAPFPTARPYLRRLLPWKSNQPTSER